MNFVTDLEAQADLFGTFRVTIFYTNGEGNDQQVVVHGVPRPVVEATVEAILTQKLKVLVEDVISTIE